MMLRWLKRVFGGGCRSSAERPPAYDFQAPAGWEVINEAGGTLVVCPDVEMDWTANMHFEMRKDRGDRTLPQMIEDLAGNLPSHKSQFQLLASGVAELPDGGACGFVEYVHRDGALVLRDRETLIPLKPPAVLFVLSSTADALAAKYTPIFEAAINSLQLPGDAAPPKKPAAPEA